MKSVKSKEKEQQTVVKADRNLLVLIITAYELFGQMVNLPEILYSEIMPVPIALAEPNDLLKSGDK